MFLRTAGAAAGMSALGLPGVAGAARVPQVGSHPREGVAEIPRTLAKHIQSGDCMLCVIGDSIATDSSTNANLSYGIQRTWRPEAWSARFGRIQGGPPAWAMSEGFDTFYYGAATGGAFANRTPGDFYSGGERSISPNLGVEWRFGSNDVPDFGPILGTVALNDPGNYAAGDWPERSRLRGRVLYWSGGAAMVGAARIRGKRGTTLIAETTVPMGSGGAGQIAFADVDCGKRSGVPTIELTSAPGVDERGKLLYWFGAGFWRCNDLGQRLPGFGLMQIGEGGWNTSDHVSPVRCGNQGLREYMAACLSPNTFLLHVGANQTPQEQQTLNAGDASLYKANIAQIIHRYSTLATLAGATAPIRWLLVNSLPVGYSEINARARGRALRELAEQNPAMRGYMDLYSLAARRNGTTSWYTADGIHPTPDGSAYLAGLLWSQIAAAL